jgi:hypothetical protein
MVRPLLDWPDETDEKEINRIIHTITGAGEILINLLLLKIVLPKIHNSSKSDTS